MCVCVHMDVPVSVKGMYACASFGRALMLVRVREEGRKRGRESLSE